MDIHLEFFPEPKKRVSHKTRIGTLRVIIFDLEIILKGIPVYIRDGEIYFRGAKAAEFDEKEGCLIDVEAFEFLDGEKRNELMLFFMTTAKEYVQNIVNVKFSEDSNS